MFFYSLFFDIDMFHQFLMYVFYDCIDVLIHVLIFMFENEQQAAGSRQLRQIRQFRQQAAHSRQ